MPLASARDHLVSWRRSKSPDAAERTTVYDRRSYPLATRLNGVVVPPPRPARLLDWCGGEERSQRETRLYALSRSWQATGMTQLCVIFDLDGTLCDTNAVDDDCYRQAAAATLAVPPSEIDWTSAPHITDSGIAHWLWERLRGRVPTPD